MISQVCLQRLRQVASYGRFDEERDQVGETMDAADEKGSLSVLILHVCFYTTTDQKLDNIIPLAPTGHMQGCC